MVTEAARSASPALPSSVTDVYKRQILGTAAVTDPVFLRTALDRFGDRVAVGVDLKDGAIAIQG